MRKLNVLRKTSLLLLSAALLAAPALAAKTYQVTGPVVEANDKTITVMKGKEKWEIDRDAATKVEGELKPGSKVTIYYRMVADTVEAKAEGAKGAGKAKGKK